MQVPPIGPYRSAQRYLFQSIGQVAYASTLGGSPFFTDSWGPLNTYVDGATGWAWASRGGDWIDATLTPQGQTPWASFAANSVSGETAAFRYSGIDVTSLMVYCQRNNHWAAFVLRVASGTGPRSVGSTFATGVVPPSISVSYSDGTSGVLACRLIALNSSGNTAPLTTAQTMSLPVFMEFDRPTKAVTSATMAITVTAHWDGAATLGLYLLNPPQSSQAVTGASGLAASAGALDAGISQVGNVIGAQRYVDGSAFTDFVANRVEVQEYGNLSDEIFYDPALWGGTSNTNRWPHTVVGKWVTSPSLWPRMALVGSAYAGEGFVPLAAGLGALKVVMPDEGVLTGQEAGYSGSLAVNAKLFMPFNEMGLLNRIFIRYYIRLGTPYVRTPATRREVRQSGSPRWTDMGGKFGISASHTTSFGGNSGSSGGPFGWQMRHSWSDCDAAQGGPLEGGLVPGWHLYDFQQNNPAGYRYGGEADREHKWGQIGGLGGMLYAGQWYCIETELKLNAVNASNNTYSADGELRTWIDGRMAYERTGMVFRTLPAYNPGFASGQIRPLRELGIKDLWWNWYNGGTLPNRVDLTIFTTGLVWAKSRIGPMRGV